MPAYGFTKHKRFAVRREVNLRAGPDSAPDGLMIELSCDGCRIAGVPRTGFAPDREVSVEFGNRQLEGRVHCRNGACIVVKFASVLRLGELEDLLVRAPERGRTASVTA